MSNKIHNTAVIHPNAKIGSGNEIGAFCVIGPYAVIGNDNLLASHVVIGSPAEHRDFFRDYGHGVEIGNGNIFREFVTINSGSHRVTTLGNNCTMLRNSHIGHDCIVEDLVTISCNVAVGGNSYIMRGANLGLNAVVHQNQVLGSWSMVGMSGVVTKHLHVTPGNTFAGNPAKLIGPNIVGIERHGATVSDVKDETARFYLLRGIK